MSQRAPQEDALTRLHRGLGKDSGIANPGMASSEAASQGAISPGTLTPGPGRVAAHLPASAHGQVPWHGSQLPLSVDPELVSATDMLSVWLPELELDGQDPWASYLSVPGNGSIRGNGHTSGLTGRAAGQDASLSHQDPSAANSDWGPEALRSKARELPAGMQAELACEELREEHAAAAVDRLYDFVHALGRLDVDSAMTCVAEDYHGLDDDREIDHRQLRLQLESLSDQLRGHPVQASLSEIPEPLAHPLGVMVHCTIQLDRLAELGSVEAHSGEHFTGEHYALSPPVEHSVRIERVVLLAEDREQGWQILTFGRFD